METGTNSPTAPSQKLGGLLLPRNMVAVFTLSVSMVCFQRNLLQHAVALNDSAGRNLRLNTACANSRRSLDAETSIHHNTTQTITTTQTTGDSKGNATHAVTPQRRGGSVLAMPPKEEFLFMTATELIQQRETLQAEESTLDREMKKHPHEQKRTKKVDSARDLHVTDAVLVEDYASGCVMVMDGNHELIEWLSYHWYTMSLRRLIILNDAKSRTTPKRIVQRWKGLMEITVWEESDIWPDGSPKAKRGMAKDNYIKRQFSFNTLCMNTLHEEGHRWVQLHDPDEYMTINERVFDKSEDMYNLHVISEDIDLPSPREAGSSLQFVKKALAYVQKFGTQGNKYLFPFETPCLPVHRKPYGNWEDKRETAALKAGVDSPAFPFGRRQGVSPLDLSTWRWRRFGSRQQKIIGKALIDLNRVGTGEIPKGGANVHVPLDKQHLCREEFAWKHESVNPLVMKHYPSTWEQALFRSSDSRGGANGRKERFKQDRQYRVNREGRNQMLDWLPGFVGTVGEAEASRLLQHAGSPKAANFGAFLNVATREHEDMDTSTGKGIIKGGHQEGSLMQATVELTQQTRDLNAPHAALKAEQQALKTHQENPHMERTIELKKLLSQEAEEGGPPSETEQDYVSACVMITDGPHELINWLAYHFHALNLRRLIIFNDKGSKTTPDQITRRWEGLVNITVWKSTSMHPNGAPKASARGHHSSTGRQKEFNKKCMKRLKLEGHHWVQLHDPDECMTINEGIHNERDPVCGLPVDTGSIDVPSPREAGSILHFVMKATAHVHKHGTQGNNCLRSFETPCVSLKRKIKLGNIEKQNKTKAENQGVKLEPSFGEKTGQSASAFSTWGRWQHWGGGQRIPGKALVNIDRILWKDVNSLVSVHVPMDHEDICRRDLMWGEEKEMPLVMNHCSPSWAEQLFGSADKRGGEQGRIDDSKTDQRQQGQHNKHSHLLEWLPGFVETVGFHEAFRLLKNSGDPETMNVGAFLELTKYLF